MGALELAALVAILAGLLVSARWVLGVDPIAGVVSALRGRPLFAAEPAGAGAIETALEEVGRGIKDLGEHIAAVRHLADERGAEVERYRDGYNFSITRSLARGVIKTVDLLADFRRQLEELHGGADSVLLEDALLRMQATSAQLEMLLEANQIEAFWPRVGESLESASSRLKPVDVQVSTQPGDFGRVAEVRYPGWMLIRGDADGRVIREAQVSVFGPAKEEGVA